jgi:hypothetical protein
VWLPKKSGQAQASPYFAGPSLVSFAVQEHLSRFDWTRLNQSLLDHGFALTPQILSSEECQALIARYGVASTFRATINMEQYNFGKGEYKYFDYPLPRLVQELRAQLYGRLAPAANVWSERLEIATRYPASLDEFLSQCRKKKQVRPTPLMLKYRSGDFNCLHQDLYGDLFFPFQVAFGLSQSGVDYEGGEVVLVKQRPRMQSVPHVIALPQGHGLIFAVNFHAQKGRRGYFRTVMRHGVSELSRGERFTLGVIFHDAK